MVVENITQRSDELVEVTENLNAIRNWLKKNVAVHQVNNQNPRPQNNPEQGSVREIYSWLNKNGGVISQNRVSEILKSSGVSVSDTYEPEILKLYFTADLKQGVSETDIYSKNIIDIF